MLSIPGASALALRAEGEARPHPEKGIPLEAVIRSCSPVAAPIDRVRERRGVQRVVAAALVSMRRFEMLPQLVEAREYRDHRLDRMLRSGGVDVVLEGMKRKTIRISTELA